MSLVCVPDDGLCLTNRGFLSLSLSFCFVFHCSAVCASLSPWASVRRFLSHLLSSPILFLSLYCCLRIHCAHAWPWLIVLCREKVTLKKEAESVVHAEDVSAVLKATKKRKSRRETQKASEHAQLDTSAQAELSTHDVPPKSNQTPCTRTCKSSTHTAHARAKKKKRMNELNANAEDEKH